MQNGTHLTVAKENLERTRTSLGRFSPATDTFAMFVATLMRHLTTLEASIQELERLRQAN